MEVTYDDLMKMDVEKLRDYNKMIVETIKMKTSLLAKERVKDVSVGDEILIEHKRHKNVVFIVEKINKKNLVGKNKETGMSYNIPFELVKKI